jgi:hypothetical protein
MAMTKSTKPVIRETSAIVRDAGDRPLIATLQGGVIKLRPKGLKTEEVIRLDQIWESAIKSRLLGKNK